MWGGGCHAKSALLSLHKVHGSLTRANRNVTCSNRLQRSHGSDHTAILTLSVHRHAQSVLYLSKIKWWWWRLRSCWWWPLKKAKLPALTLDPPQPKWVCVWLQACQGSLQQNSINCLDLSRLIILHSISFKQETSHFCLFSYHSPGQSVDNYSAVKDCRPPPPAF